MDQKDNFNPYTEQEFNPYATPTVVDPVQVFGSQKTLDQVATGFNLVYWGLVVMLVSVILLFFLSIALGAAGNEMGMQVVTLALALAVLVGWILDLVGKFMCLAVPAETNAKPLIVAAVVCIVCNIGLTIAQLVMVFSGNLNFEVMTVMRLVAFGLGLTGFLLFLIFIKRIAQFMSRNDLSDRAQTVIVILIIMYAIIGVIALTPLGRAVPILAIVGGLSLLVLGLVFLILYARLLVDSRKAIQGVY